MIKDIENLRRPRSPEPDECCGSGCYPCVFDTYYDMLEKYEDKKQAIELKYEEESDGE